jgi:formylmethanofuran dehydrogenase subunit E
MKVASFDRRATKWLTFGKAIRIVTRPNAADGSDPEHGTLFERVCLGRATPEEQMRFEWPHAQRAQQILDVPEDALFEVQAVEPRIPPKARILNSLLCEQCGEMVMETRARRWRPTTASTAP